MKKLFLLFLVILFVSFVSASICCSGGCDEDTATIYGLTYNLKCCDNNAYMGCGDYNLDSYCKGDILGCLECKNSTIVNPPFGTYYWNAFNCGACKICGVAYGQQGGYDLPISSGCVFDTDPVSGFQYHCIGGVSTCLIEGGNSSEYCCKSDGTAHTPKPPCAPYIQGNSCYYGSTPQCLASTGWSCTAYLEDTVPDYTGCYTKGYLDSMGTPDTSDDRCYYTNRVVDCVQTGWQCTSGAYCVTNGGCFGQPDSDGDNIPDVCDTETEDPDCLDKIDNDGNGNCDVNGDNCCQDINGNGACEPEEYTSMPADPNCAAEFCSECKWPFCSEATCEGVYKPSTGSGSCYYKGGFIKPCCDDSDNDNICDSSDNCPWDNNPSQGDNDGDGVGDLCDTCPNIAYPPNPLSVNSDILCTGSEEITCSGAIKCRIVDVGEQFFCDGSIWISRNLCTDCFFFQDVEYYWIDNYDKICDLTTPQMILTDDSDTVCEFLVSDVQNGCDDGETGCWDIYASGANTKCCGDDSVSDTWVDSNNEACYEGTFYTDPDDLDLLCELLNPGTQGDCDTHEEIGCWDSASSKCCGDDTDETWIYSTNNKIDDILVEQGCYKGKWFVRTQASVTYYEIFT